MKIEGDYLFKVSLVIFWEKLLYIEIFVKIILGVKYLEEMVLD